MAPKKKLYLHYDLGGDTELHTTLKLTLPTKWGTEPSDKVLDFFVTSYNTKHETNALDAASVHFQLGANGAHVATGVPCAEAFEDRGVYFIRDGPAPAAPVRAPAPAAAAPAAAGAGAEDGQLRCRRFGCQQFFREEENTNESCHFHSGSALFHQMKKGWSCCSEGGSTGWAWDWDEFQRLPTCSVGRHSTDDPGALLAESPTVVAGRDMEGAAAAATSAPPAAPLRSIDAYNSANPDAASATDAATRMVTQGHKRRERDDGTVYCVNNGCRQWFREDDSNTPSSCHYHGAPPTFHDRSKQWNCCGRRGTSFEELLAVEGCLVGPHVAGTE